MYLKSLNLLLGLSFLLFGSVASAKLSAERLSIHGNVWTKATYDLTEDVSDPLGFDVYRGFFIVDYDFGNNWRSSANLDVRTSVTKIHLIGGFSSVSLFWAFIEKAQVFGGDDVLRFGQQPTFYLEGIHEKLGSRWLSMSLAQEAGFLNSMQAGVGYKTMLGESFKLGLQFHNGNAGTGKTVINDLAAAVTLTYEAGRLGVSVNDEWSSPGAGSLPASNVINGAVYFLSDFAKFAGEVAFRNQGGSKATGFGGTILASLTEKIGAYGRMFTGNDAFKAAIAADAIVTVGPTYEFMEAINSALLFETRTGLSGANANNVVSFLLTAEY